MDSISKTIYQDELFNFTIDDLYFIRNDIGVIYILLDISKYFNILDSCFNYIGNKKNTNAFIFNGQNRLRLHKHKLIAICCFGYAYYNIHIMQKLNLNSVLNKSHDIGLPKLVPEDSIIATHTDIRSLISANKLDTFYNLHSWDSKKKHTDRKCRSSHHNMNWKKHIINLTNKSNKPNTNKKYINKELNRAQCKPYPVYTQRKHIYKKAKKINYLTGLKYIENPLEDINNSLYKILYIKSLHGKNTLMYESNLKYKKYYKFIRMVYVLTALKRYDAAALLYSDKNAALVNHKDNSYKDNSYNVDKKKQNLYIDDISKKTIDKYKKKFDQLYYQISKCKYEYNNNNSGMNINHYIIPETKKKIASVFKSYTKLYKLQQGNNKKEFLYLFKNINDTYRTGLILIKPKFI